jgi:glycogen debranching enzyme
MAELGHVQADDELVTRSRSIAAAMDTYLWNDEEQLWDDLAVVGGGPSVRVPISDGVMGALVTDDSSRAAAALQQLEEPDRFAAEFGPSNVARTHPAYDPLMYWRGPAWPQLNYLLWLAQRRWGRMVPAAQLAERTLASALTSGFAEYWNPETGDGLGAIPQSWTGLVVAMTNVGRTNGR